MPYPKGTSVKVEIGGLQVAADEIRVRDILVAAMGDSYASGEGNPDIPVRFSRDRSADYGTVSDDGRRAGYPARIGNWQTIGDKTFIAENARWLDQACHRSLYSQQLRAALQLAVEDPHRAVTFVGVACSGAEVSWGLFLRYKGNEWVPNPPLLSQISAVAEAQCGTKETSALDLPEAYHINGQIPELKGGLVLRKCGRENAREIDLVLLSVGGNDIGFSRLIANAVLSDASLLRELGGWLGEVHGETEASAQLTRLDARYKSLNRAIHSLLYVPWSESDRIILTAYPGLALTGDGSETCKDGRAGLDVLPDFQLSEQKLRIGTWIADKLHRQMRKSALSYGWTFVETHRRQFIGRSICSGVTIDGATSNDELRIPRKIDNKWVPYNPVDYKPYATRQRWFRTPNDAFMTGNFHVAASLLNKVLKLDTLAWFQLVLASTYSGAFHPTAEGHAAIADAVVEKARVVLAKYGQGTTSGSAPYGVSADDAPPPPVDEPGVQMPDINSVLSSPAPATPQTPPTESPPAAAAPVPEPTPAAVAPETMPPPVPETSPMPPLPEERSSGTQHSDPAAAGFPAGNDEGAAAPMSGDADWQATPSPAPQPLPAQEPAVGAPDDASGWQSSPSPPAPQPDAEPGLKPLRRRRKRRGQNSKRRRALSRLSMPKVVRGCASLFLSCC